ncbi:MAG: hypothetical protein ABH828_01370 [archaeon]
MNPVMIAGIAILVAVVCIFLAFRFGRHFFKLFALIVLIFLFILLLIGIIIVSDSASFKERSATEDTLFLLANQDTVLAGIVVKPAKQETGIKSVQDALENVIDLDFEPEIIIEPYIFPSKTRLDDFTSLYRNDYLQSLSTIYYKTFVFDKSIFEEMNQDMVDLGSVELTVKDILEVLESEDPIQSLAVKLGWTRENLIKSLPKNAGGDVRGPLFSVLLVKVTGEKVNTLSPIFKYIKEGRIHVYPTTMMFKSFKSLPDSIIKVIIGRGG